MKKTKGLSYLLCGLLLTSPVISSSSVLASETTLSTQQNVRSNEAEKEIADVERKPETSSLQNSSADSVSKAEPQLTVNASSPQPIVSEVSETNQREDPSPQIQVNNEEVSNDIASGSIGTSNWRIDSTGVLHIGAGNFGGSNPGVSGIGPWKAYKDTINLIRLEGPVTNPGGKYNNLFSGLERVTNIEGIEFLDTTNVTELRNLFSSLTSLQGTLDLSHFNTSSVTNMNQMFANDSLLSGINLSSFDTSNVTDMGGMFENLSSLQTLDLSNFDTSAVTWNTYFLFGTTRLSQLKVGSKFDFGDDAMLPEIDSNTTYTGKWQNVGNGSVSSPTGKNVWSSSEFMSNYIGGTDADTYVWQYASAPATKGADVTTKYVDEEGNKISEDVVKSGNVGENYTTEQKDIDGYTFKEVQGDAQGTFTDQAQTVTYVYTKNPVKGVDVTTKYVDEEGNKISEDVVKSGNVGENYTTEQKDIDGYTFKEVQGNAQGIFTDQAQTVTYVYTKNELPNIMGTVIVKYMDTEGHSILKDLVKSGTIGDWYSTEQRDIDGYIFKEVQGNPTGQFTDKNQTVTYIYTKDKHNTISSELKLGIKLSHNDKNSDKGTLSSSQSDLPATGENERMTLMSVGIGLILLMIALIASVFRFKRLKKKIKIWFE